MFAQELKKTILSIVSDIAEVLVFITDSLLFVSFEASKDYVDIRIASPTKARIEQIHDWHLLCFARQKAAENALHSGL